MFEFLKNFAMGSYAEQEQEEQQDEEELQTNFELHPTSQNTDEPLKSSEEEHGYNIDSPPSGEGDPIDKTVETTYLSRLSNFLWRPISDSISAASEYNSTEKQPPSEPSVPGSEIPTVEEEQAADQTSISSGWSYNLLSSMKEKIAASSTWIADTTTSIMATVNEQNLPEAETEAEPDPSDSEPESKNPSVEEENAAAPTSAKPSWPENLLSSIQGTLAASSTWIADATKSIMSTANEQNIPEPNTLPVENEQNIVNTEAESEPNTAQSEAWTPWLKSFLPSQIAQLFSPSNDAAEPNTLPVENEQNIANTEAESEPNMAQSEAWAPWLKSFLPSQIAQLFSASNDAGEPNNKGDKKETIIPPVPYHLLQNDILLQELLREGHLTITALPHDPAEAPSVFRVQFFNASTEAQVVLQASGEEALKIGDIEIPLKKVYLQPVSTDTYTAINPPNQLPEVIEQKIEIEPPPIKFYFKDSLVELNNNIDKIIDPVIKQKTIAVKNNLVALHKAGENPAILAEYLDLTNRLLTARPGEQRKEIAEQYTQLATRAPISKSPVWRALGIAMIVLGGLVLAAGVAVLIASVAIPGGVITATGGAITAGVGVGLMLAGLGVFAGNRPRKATTEAMTTLNDGVKSAEGEVLTRPPAA